MNEPDTEWHYYQSPDVGWVVCGCTTGDGDIDSDPFFVTTEATAKALAAILNRQQAEIRTLRAALARAHNVLDNMNADVMREACQFCAGESYDGDGLKHEEDCIVKVLRRLI